MRGHLLNDEDLTLRKHILNLMTKMSTSWNSTEDNVEVLKHVSEKLAEMQSDGLVNVTPSTCEVTEEGRAFLRNVCMAFDARLIRKAPETRLFSQTV
jgi:oxygen-independent coproporphyrinogen-3 oxidase